MLFVELPETEDEMATIGRELGDKPLIANMVEGGRTPMLSNARLAEIGYALAVYPVAGLLSARGGAGHGLPADPRDWLVRWAHPRRSIPLWR